MECFILGGGSSKRFGSDKLLFPIDGKPIIEHVIESAKKVCNKVRIVAKSGTKFSHVNVPVVCDIMEEQASIIGILTAMEVAKERNLLILSGDIPFIKKEILELLINEFQEPATIFKINGKYHPLIGMYSKNIKDKLYNHINNGNFCLTEFILNIKAKFIPENIARKYDPELISFININTTKDLAKAKQITGKAS